MDISPTKFIKFFSLNPRQELANEFNFFKNLESKEKYLFYQKKNHQGLINEHFFYPIFYHIFLNAKPAICSQYIDKHPNELSMLIEFIEDSQKYHFYNDGILSPFDIFPNLMNYFNITDINSARLETECDIYWRILNRLCMSLHPNNISIDYLYEFKKLLFSANVRIRTVSKTEFEEIFNEEE